MPVVNGDGDIDVVADAGLESCRSCVVSRADKFRITSMTDPKSPTRTTGHFKPNLTSNRHNIINVLQK